MAQPKIGPHDRWVCPLCYPQKTEGIGYNAQRLHNKEAHGGKPGWMSLGKRGKKPKQFRCAPRGPGGVLL